MVTWRITTESVEALNSPTDEKQRITTMAVEVLRKRGADPPEPPEDYRTFLAVVRHGGKQLV